MVRRLEARHDGRRVGADDLAAWVNKYFGSQRVLKEIDMDVGRGVVVVLGPSRSGKSMLCRVVNRLETVDSGTIVIDGVLGGAGVRLDASGSC